MHWHPASNDKNAKRTTLVLRISLAATLAYVVVTFVAGLRAHSLALLSESGHNVSDFLALLLSFAAVYFQSRPADHARTFGYQRAGVLAAFINAATLIAISLWIAVEAVHRLSAPVAVEPRLMMIVAAAGVAMNGIIAALLWGVARDVNLRSAFLHMAGDTLSTAAVIAGGFGILLTGQNWIDPVLSLLIAALIFWSSIGIVRETLNILLEGAPRGCSPAQIRSGMEAVEGVVNVHDLHVWCLGSNSRALACHVTIADIPPSESACILIKLNGLLREQFQISHTTIQFEHIGCEHLRGLRRASRDHFRWPRASSQPRALAYSEEALSLARLHLAPAALRFALFACAPAAAWPQASQNQAATPAQTVTAAQLEALTGAYANRNEPDTPLSIYVEDGKLVYESERRLPVALEPISPTEFAIPNTKSSLRFALDSSGRGASVVLSQGSDHSVSYRIGAAGAPRLPRLRAH